MFGISNIKEDIIDLFHMNYDMNSRIIVQQSQIEGLLELSKMQSKQMNAILEYMGVSVKQISTPAKTEYKVVKVTKKEKK